jgi:hypothetical protein
VAGRAKTKPAKDAGSPRSQRATGATEDAGRRGFAAGRAHNRPGDRGRYRQHGIVVAAPLARAVALAGVGAALLVVGWPASAGGALVLAAAAFAGVRSVWRWERTRLMVAGDRLVVVHGTLRRRSASASIDGAVEVERTLLGRLLGYGTIVAGELEVPFVPRGLVRRVSS